MQRSGIWDSYSNYNTKSNEWSKTDSSKSRKQKKSEIIIGNKQLRKLRKKFYKFDWGYSFSTWNIWRQSGTIPILRQQRVRKIAILNTFSTIYADVEWVGGSEKVQKSSKGMVP